MAYNALPSLEYLQSLFRPNFRAGTLTWRPKYKSRNTGRIAGTTSTNGLYCIVKIDGRVYFLHRVLYTMYHGQDPGEMQVDHVNLDGLDNCVDNLRLATPAQNRQNGKRKRTGLKGAYPSTNNEFPWRSSIDANGERYPLGLFKTEEEAHEAYVVASARYHGKFGRTH